jgi:SOS response regulatory protein OraA/RecX
MTNNNNYINDARFALLECQSVLDGMKRDMVTMKKKEKGLTQALMQEIMQRNNQRNATRRNQRNQRNNQTNLLHKPTQKLANRLKTQGWTQSQIKNTIASLNNLKT